MRGSLPIACILSLGRKTPRHWDPFHFDFYNDQQKRIDKSAHYKVTTVDSEPRTMTSLMTPEYSTMQQVTTPKETLTTQAVTPMDKNPASGAQFDQTDPKPLSVNEDVLHPQVSKQEKNQDILLSSEKKDMPNEHTAKGSLSTSCSINSSNTVVSAELKESFKTEGQKFLIAGEDSLLYSEFLDDDDDGSIDLDSSLEGKLLVIDESMSEEETDKDTATETVESQAPMLPKIAETTPSLTQNLEIDEDIGTENHEATSSPTQHLEINEDIGTENHEATSSPTQHLEINEDIGTENHEATSSPTQHLEIDEDIGTENHEATSSPTQHLEINEDIGTENHVALTVPLTDKTASSPTQDKEINEDPGTVELQAQTILQIDEQAASTIPHEEINNDIETVEVVVPMVTQVEESFSSSTQYKKMNKDPGMEDIVTMTVPQIDEQAASTTLLKEINNDIEMVEVVVSTVPQVEESASSSTQHKKMAEDPGMEEIVTMAVPQIDEQAACATPHKEINRDIETVELAVPTVPQVDKLASSSTPIEEIVAATVPEIGKKTFSSSPVKDMTKDLETVAPDPLTFPQIVKPVSSSTMRKEMTLKLETVDMLAPAGLQIDKPVASSTPNKEISVNFETVKLQAPSYPAIDKPSSSPMPHKEIAEDLGRTKITIKTEMPELCYQEQMAPTVLQISEPPSSTPQKEMRINMEIVKLEASSCSQVEKTTSAPLKEIKKDPERTDIASEMDTPKLSCQELPKDLDVPEQLSNTESSKVYAVAEMNGTDDISSGNPRQKLTKSPILFEETYVTEQDWNIMEKQLKSNDQLSKRDNINLEKFLTQSQNVVLEEALRNKSVIFDGSDDMPTKMIPNNKDDLKDKAAELASIAEPSNQIKLNGISTKSHGTPIQPSASPDSTTTTGEELSPKWVSCRKVSFVLVENKYVCLSCCKRFTTELLFKRHVWGHFHGCESRPQLCNQCPPKQYFSPCPAVNKVFTMLRNSCSKDVSSLRLNLSLNVPLKDKDATDKNKAAPPEKNSLKNSPQPLTNKPSTFTINPSPLLPQPSQIVGQTSEGTDSCLRGGHSVNQEYLTVFIACQQLICTKCRQCIEPSHLVEHIYRHLHTSTTTIPEHGTCISEKKCDIMAKLVPLIPDPETRKAGFHLLDISWKWTIQKDLKFQIMLIRHNRKSDPSPNHNRPFISSKEDLQVLKASTFIIPNQTREECVAAESNPNAKEVVISEKESVDDSVVFLESIQGRKTTKRSAKTDRDGYKQMIFVIKGNDHICTSCRKSYASLDSLKSHIMWHFHSKEKLCSISHYDGQQSQEKECPILTNIMNCIPNDPERENEAKRVTVNWKKNSADRTSFKVQYHYQRNIIDLTKSDDEDDNISEQSGKDSMKKEITIDLNENTASPTEIIKPAQKEIGKLKHENIPSASTNSQASSPCKNFQSDQASHSCNSVQSEITKNSPLETEGGFYICGFPGCRFSSIESTKFVNHFEELHSSEKIFPCAHCGYNANGRDLLMEHMETHVNHTLFLLYRCSMCEYATNLLPDFEKHLRSCHSENGRYMCCSCKESFRVIDLLLKHLSKNLLKFIVCPHCSARDVYRRHMLDHIKAHHPDKPRQIIVSSQIICKTINQNKLIAKDPKLKEALTRRSKNKENVVIVLDDEEEDCDTSTDKDETVKETNRASKLGLLVNLLNKVDSKQKPFLDRLLTDGEKSGVSKTKSGEASPKHSHSRESENRKASVIDDHVNDSDNCNEQVVQKKPKHQSKILSKMLSNNQTKKAKADDGAKEVGNKGHKSKNSSVKKGNEEEKKKKNTREHYTVKDISKFPCELKVRLRRLSSSEEVGEPKRQSPNLASASAKERNVFNLFGEIDKTNVGESLIPGSTGDEVQNAASSTNEEQFPISSGCESRLPECEPGIAESSGGGAEMTSTEGQSSFKRSNLDREDSVDNDGTDNEEMTGPKMKKPSLRQEVSLGGSTLDLRLQKCYSKVIQNNQEKQLVCDVCQEVFKTAYRIHLHLLSEHLKWPLWECQDCRTRAYSHSKMTSHCWRHHKNQLPRIISLDMPVIERKDNNIIIHNSPEEFEEPEGMSTVDGSGKKNVNSKFKKGSNSVSASASPAESPKQSAKISRKRSASANSEDKEQDSKRSKSSTNKSLQDTTNSNSTPGAGRSVLVIRRAPVSSAKRDGPDDREQPPRKKSKSCDPDRNEEKCSMCDYRCCSKSSLDLLRHMIQEHMKEFQNFISEEEIEQVEDAITGNPLEGFVCPFCGQNMEQRVSCKIHIWRTHGHLEYLHCDQCKFVTWFEHHMQKHVADEHTGSRASGLSKDEETPVDQSGNNVVTSAAVTSATSPQIQQKGDVEKTTRRKKELHCNKCKYATFSKQDLKDHFEKHHLNKKVNGVSKKKTSTKLENPTTSSASLPPKKASSSSGVGSKNQKKTFSITLPPHKSSHSDKNKKNKKINASSDGNDKNHKKNHPVLAPGQKASHSEKSNPPGQKASYSEKSDPPVLAPGQKASHSEKSDPPVLAPGQKASHSEKSDPPVLAPGQKASHSDKSDPPVLSPVQKASHSEKSNRDKRKTPPVLSPIQDTSDSDKNKQKNPPLMHPVLKSSPKDESKINKEKTPQVSLPTLKVLSSDEISKKDKTPKQIPETLPPPQKASCSNNDKSSKTPPVLFLLTQASSIDEGSNRDKTFQKKTPPVSLPLQGTLSSDESNKKDKNERSSEKCPEEESQKNSDKHKNPGKDMNSKDKDAVNKSLEANKNSPLYRKILPKPPFEFSLAIPIRNFSVAIPIQKVSGASPNQKSSGASPSQKSSGASPTQKSSGASPRSSSVSPSHKTSGASSDLSQKFLGASPNQKSSGAIPSSISTASPSISGASPSHKSSGASPSISGASPSQKFSGASPRISGASTSQKFPGASTSQKFPGASPNEKFPGASPNQKFSGASLKSSGASPSHKSLRSSPRISGASLSPSQTSSETKTPAQNLKTNRAAINGTGSAVRSDANSTSVYVTSICPKTKKRLYHCSICSALRYSMFDVLNHCKKHRDVLYSCSECPYQKHNRDRVFEHLKLAHRNEGRVHSTSGNSLKGRLKLEEERKKKK